MNLQDMKQRRSVRTFDGKGLDPEMLAAMREFLAMFRIRSESK